MKFTGVGQVFRRTRAAFDVGLTAEFSFSAHFPRDTRHFGGK